MIRPTIIIMGSAGSGKGTQSSLIQEQMGYHVAEAGAILRAEGERGTDIGRKAMEIINAGKHLSDEMVTEIIKGYILRVPLQEDLLVDGYPRTLGQKDFLHEMLKQAGRDKANYVAVWIKVDRLEAERRLSNRAQCDVCKTVFMSKDSSVCPHCGGAVKPRDYDYPESIQKRLDFFAEKIMPVIESYRSEGKLIEVDGMQEVAHVFDHIKAKLRQLSKFDQAR